MFRNRCWRSNFNQINEPPFWILVVRPNPGLDMLACCVHASDTQSLVLMLPAQTSTLTFVFGADHIKCVILPWRFIVPIIKRQMFVTTSWHVWFHFLVHYFGSKRIKRKSFLHVLIKRKKDVLHDVFVLQAYSWCKVKVGPTVELL